MISSVIHTMIATQNKESGFKVVLTLHGGVYFFDDRIHFLLLGNHVSAEAQSGSDQTLKASNHTSWDQIYDQYDQARDNA
jgi:hypothetical protein